MLFTRILEDINVKSMPKLRAKNLAGRKGILCGAFSGFFSPISSRHCLDLLKASL